MSLVTEPEQVVTFCGPRTERLQSFVTLKNVHLTKKLAIKFKANCNAIYMKPNRYLIEPHSELTVALNFKPKKVTEGKAVRVKIFHCLFAASDVTIDNFELFWRQSECFQHVHERLLQIVHQVTLKGVTFQPILEVGAQLKADCWGQEQPKPYDNDFNNNGDVNNNGGGDNVGDNVGDFNWGPTEGSAPAQAWPNDNGNTGDGQTTQWDQPNGQLAGNDALNHEWGAANNVTQTDQWGGNNAHDGQHWGADDAQVNQMPDNDAQTEQWNGQANDNLANQWGPETGEAGQCVGDNAQACQWGATAPQTDAVQWEQPANAHDPNIENQWNQAQVDFNQAAPVQQMDYYRGVNTGSPLIDMAVIFFGILIFGIIIGKGGI